MPHPSTESTVKPSATAVSYTHLDVYKRQALTEYLEGFVSERRRNRLHEVLAERTNHMTLVLEDVYQSHNFSAVLRSADIFGIQTVSYTHLDVYKRQVIVSMVVQAKMRWKTCHRMN